MAIYRNDDGADPNGYEEDYRRVVDRADAARMLPGSTIEIIRDPGRKGPPRHVLFDFDGTLSLIREGWPEVMVPLMVETLLATGTSESPDELRRVCNDFVTHLTGKQTIYQMIRLAEEVKKRGGAPEAPSVYKQQYLDRLSVRIAGRREGLLSGRIDAREMLVPYSLELLDDLQGRGVALYVASGTDEPFVVEEVAMLGLDRYFGPRVYGAKEDFRAFSKAQVIERILRDNRLDGESLLAFGDGYVEIRNVKEAGGTAIGVASDEAGRSGRPDPWKRDRLIGAGADVIVPDYRDFGPLLDYLWTANGE
ncbi:MAG: haloacid dehalogenase-like hydrolase [Pirellulales bacterium]|nr:haloacid dehalogenase-like hydrolase [Pirellulales bacterium]